MGKSLAKEKSNEQEVNDDTGFVRAGELDRMCAQDSTKQDIMQKDQTKQSEMKPDSMGKDAMKQDSMGNDNLKKDET